MIVALLPAWSPGDKRSGPVAGYADIGIPGLNPSAIDYGIISFWVNGTWMKRYRLGASDIVMLRHYQGIWEELPTTFEYGDGSTYYFTATTPGFSYFAVATRNLTPTNMSVTRDAFLADKSMAVTPGAIITAITTPAITPEPTVTTYRTRTAPLSEKNPTGFPGIPDYLFIIASVYLVLMAGGVFLLRRWWIRRQNPSLFRKYD